MPFLKALALASVAFPLASATQSDIPATAHPEVMRVVCLGSVGTAFRISKTRALSVAHVTNAYGCFIENRPFEVIYKYKDFSILTIHEGRGRAKIDCNGFVPGRKYRALGYARGRPTLTMVDGLVATGEKWVGPGGTMAVLKGIFTVIPGQSGGPVIDVATGKVVGLVNMYDPQAGLSASLPLKGTAACSA